MALEYPNVIAAAGKVDIDGSGTTWHSGFKVLKTGVGTYSIVLDRPLDPANRAIFVTARPATQVNILAQAFDVSDSTFNVVTHDYGAMPADTDCAFDLEVLQRGAH